MFRTIVFVAAVSVLTVVSVADSFACTLSFRTPTLKPHFWMENGEAHGIARDFMDLVGEKSACDVRYQETPWKRALRQIEDGEADVTIGYYNAERAAFARFSTAQFGQDRIFLFGRKDEASLDSLVDVFENEKWLIYPTGWYLGKLLEKVEAYSEQTTNVPLPRGVKMLAVGHGDVLIGPEYATFYQAVQSGVRKEIKIISPTLSTFSQYVFFSRKSVSEAQFKVFDDAITAVLNSGEMEEIVRRYTE